MAKQMQRSSTVAPVLFSKFFENDESPFEDLGTIRTSSSRTTYRLAYNPDGGETEGGELLMIRGSEEGGWTQFFVGSTHSIGPAAETAARHIQSAFGVYDDESLELEDREDPELEGKLAEAGIAEAAHSEESFVALVHVIDRNLFQGDGRLDVALEDDSPS
jgi:hypothetical protein